MMLRQNKGTTRGRKEQFFMKKKGEKISHARMKKRRKNGWIFIFAKNIIISFFFR